jgi:hypothetical protein
MTQFGIACQRPTIFTELLVYITSPFPVEIVWIYLRLVCSNKAEIDHFIVWLLCISLVNKGRGLMMENAGRDELRDRRAGWLTGKVLRRRYQCSSHDAITYPSRPLSSRCSLAERASCF